MTRLEAESILGSISGADADALGAYGFELLGAILSGASLWCEASRVPGGVTAAYRLAAAGWVDLWTDHPAGLHATLTGKAADRLGVAAEESPRIEWAQDEEGESWRSLECGDRWTPRGVIALKHGYVMPRSQRMAGLAFPDAVGVPVRDPIRAPAPAGNWPTRILAALVRPRGKKSRRRRDAAAV